MILRPKVTLEVTLTDLYYEYLSQLHGTDPGSVCYVSGPISPRNGQSAAQNIDNLQSFAREIDDRGIFSKVIDPSAVENLEAQGWSRDEALIMWINLLRSGRVGMIAMATGYNNVSTKK